MFGGTAVNTANEMYACSHVEQLTMRALSTILAATSWQRLALGLDMLLLSCGVLCLDMLCCVVQLRSEYDSRGQLVFRGPRLRIGLCEGVPRTVMPDHLGR
jgi:hypothetical protein